jgi:hypothetical protein
MRAALGRVPRFEELAELGDRRGLQVDDLGLPQYMTSLPLGGSAFISTGPSSSIRGAGFGFSGVSSFSVGASPVASGTLCNACCRFGLRLVYRVTSIQRPAVPICV